MGESTCCFNMGCAFISPEPLERLGTAEGTCKQNCGEWRQEDCWVLLAASLVPALVPDLILREWKSDRTSYLTSLSVFPREDLCTHGLCSSYPNREGKGDIFLGRWMAQVTSNYKQVHSWISLDLQSGDTVLAPPWPSSRLSHWLNTCLGYNYFQLWAFGLTLGVHLWARQTKFILWEVQNEWEVNYCLVCQGVMNR